MSKEVNIKLINFFEEKNLDGIVELMNPFIKMMANKLYYSSRRIIEANDLVSNGYIGLLDAIAKFNLSKSNNLKSYAQIRIKGAMLDYIRKQDKLPRSMRDKINAVKKATAILEGKLGRKATDKEISVEMSFSSVEEYYKHLTTIKRAFYINLKDFYPNSDKSLELEDERQKTPQRKYENKIRNNYLTSKIEVLNVKQKKVIEMHYIKEMNLKAISEEMDLTESRISQLHLAALKILRKEVDPEIIYVSN